LSPYSVANGSWFPSLSPDGGRCAYLSDRGGRPQVWVDDRLIDTGPSPVVAVQWSTVGDWLACELTPGGAPRHEVWIVRPDGSDLRQVAGFGADTAENMRWLPGRSLLAVTENLTTGLLIDPDVGARSVVAKGELISLLDVSAGRALLRVGPRGARHVVSRDLISAQDHFWVRGEQATFGADGETVFARDESGEFPALVRLDADGSTVLASSGAAAEVEAFALSPAGNALAVLWNIQGGQSEISLLSVDGGEVRRPALPGSVAAGLSWNVDGSRLAFAAEGPGQPHGVWVHDGETRAVSATAAAEGAVRPTLETFPGHDGLALTGWLFRPGGDGPHPTVVWLHGGPEAQERPGHQPLFQALVSQGIAVFAPNVRGSSGFGRSFVNADNGPLRYAAIEDVRSCVRHLAGSGISEISRIGCMGRSYGGYLTLAALTSFPDLFAVGVDVCGMSNFFTFYRYSEPWIAKAAISKYGDPSRDQRLLHDLSPINHLDRLRAPLLIVHGANDTNVPLIEATQLAEALAERRHPHRLRVFPGEGHELLHHENRAAYVRETVDWLTAHLIADRT
jgi:dipeptidyl aminopeptidase/acylaminoacyl peptidase